MDTQLTWEPLGKHKYVAHLDNIRYLEVSYGMGAWDWMYYEYDEIEDGGGMWDDPTEAMRRAEMYAKHHNLLPKNEARP